MKTEPVPSHQHDFYESKTSLWIEAEYGEKFPTNLASHLALAALEDNRASMQSQQLLRRKGSSCLFFPSFFFVKSKVKNTVKDKMMGDGGKRKKLQPKIT